MLKKPPEQLKRRSYAKIRSQAMYKKNMEQDLKQ